MKTIFFTDFWLIINFVFWYANFNAHQITFNLIDSLRGD